MKKHLLTLTVFAFVFGFSSCRDTPAENSEEVEILETPEETTIQEVQEEETDTTTIDSMESDT